MKVNLLHFALILVSVGSLAAQEPLFSTRVGAEIDSAERRYFNIFPDIQDFVSTRASRSGDTVVIFTIHRGGGLGDTTVSTSLRIVEDLRRYMDRCERLFVGDTIQLDWSSLRMLVQPRKPFQDNPVELNVLTRSGEHLRGPVLYADDTSLVLSVIPSNHPAEVLAGTFRILNVSEIERVQDDWGIIGRLFNTFDLPVGGNQAAFDDEVLPRIQSDLFYVYGIPPELAASLARYQIKPEDMRAPVPLSQIDKESGGHLTSLINGTESGVRGRRRGRPWNAVHLHVASGQVLERDRSQLSGSWIPGPDFVSFGVDLSILRWLRFGLSYSMWQMPGRNSDSTYNYYYVFGDGLQVTLALVPLRPGTSKLPLLNRLEMAVETGVTLRYVTGDYFGESTNETISGSMAAIGISYYPVEQISVGPVLRAMFYPENKPGDKVPVPLALDSYDLLLKISLHL